MACGGELDLYPEEPEGEGGVEQPLSARAFFALSPDQGTFNATQAQAQKALGAGMVRLQLCNWPQEKAQITAQVTAARAAGLEVYLELNYCTTYMPADPVARIKHWHQNFSDSGNAFSQTFTQAAGEIAAHFKGQVAYYEIWNEPNASPKGGQSNPDWNGACGIGPGGYVYFNGGEAWGLCPRQLGVVTTNAFMAIKGKDPAARVVAGNMLQHGEDGWVGKLYWKEVAKSPAVQWHLKNKGRYPWDVVGFHPYHSDARTADFQKEINDFKSLLASTGDPAKLAITEYGWRTGPKLSYSPEFWVDEASQAAILRAAFETSAKNGLAFLVWFNYLDGSHSSGYRFGIRRQDNSWKPSATAFCQVAGATACPTGWRPLAIGKRPDGSQDSAISACHQRNGGAASAGQPFDNGGGDHVHGWGSGDVQDFKGGSLGPNLCMRGHQRSWAWMVRGAIRTEYFAQGGGAGWLGYPREDERVTAGGPYQAFDGGYLAWDPGLKRFRAWKYGAGVESPNAKPVGHLDHADGSWIRGWAHDPDAGKTPIDVQVLLNGKVHATIRANERRDDLVLAKATPDAFHGFSVSLAGLAKGTYSVQVRALDRGAASDPFLPGGRTITR